VTISVSALDARVILLDIEGTTTPVDFVVQVLFPYARAHVADFLVRHGHARATCVAVEHLHDELHAAQAAGEGPPALLLDYVGWLMDRDRKSSGLKMLQGLIWQEGFVAGELRGQVYPDVPPAFVRWSARDVEIGIYSSGSALAQRLLFGSTHAGDLTGYLTAYFDTSVGPKTSPDSYRRIAELVKSKPVAILFVSDVARELDAAKEAGLHTALCMRENADDASTGTATANDVSPAHPVIRTFDEIVD
jgi:enolase-phosphatase E1